MENIKELLKKIDVEFTESEDQTDLFTTYHTKFDCIMKYNGITYKFNYQCNTCYIEPNKNDLILCALQDANAYESTKINDDDFENIEEFIKEFGYNDNLKEGLKAYKGCKNAYNNIIKMFTNEEKESLFEFLENGDSE